MSLPNNKDIRIRSTKRNTTTSSLKTNAEENRNKLHDTKR